MEMENNNSMTSQESLDLIARMIRNTRTNLEPGDGSPFLIWGYTTCLTTLAVWSAWKFTGTPHANWIWFAIPLFGSLWTYTINRKKPKRVRTFLDRAIALVWTALGLAAFGSAMVAMFSNLHMSILTMIAMLMFCGQAITGGLVKLKYIQYAGYAGIILSLGLYFLPENWPVFGFGLLFSVIMVIPGHIMNIQAKKEAKLKIPPHV